ncbi:MAG: hypothetical protein DWH99_13185 [Planctomycetota bacterium]|nr:MAG: hypothetical protein DWH99_13185 [Planctomycetota bacterium]
MVARFSTCALAYFFVATSMLAIVPKAALAQPNPTASNSALNFYGDGFVLLQHGAVLQGFVKPQADSVTVVMDKGKQVTLAKKQILVIGPSMDSLYKYQTRAIRKWGTGEHWHLAQWCIQNGMLDQAIEHYLELEKQAADNPKFKQLDLQLKQALMADENVRQAMAIQGIQPPEPVVQASAVLPRAPASSEPSFPVHTVPGYLRRNFQTEITPIVVSRCGQSGCHGILSKNNFQIFQPVGEQAASINERNLEKFLRFVDASQPDQSDLLNYAARPHGAQRNASFNLQREEDRHHLEKLAKWIRSLEGLTPQSPSPSTTNPSAPNPVVQAAVYAKPESTSEVKQAVAPSPKLSKPPKNGSGSVAIDAGELMEIQEEIRKLEKAASKQTKATDPFDAKIFNSKYRNEDPANAQKPNSLPASSGQK